MGQSKSEGGENGEVITVDFKNRNVVSRQTVDQTLTDKFGYFAKLIEDRLVNVSFCPSMPGVKVHDAIRSKRIGVLAWSHRFGLHDFVFTNEGIGGTLLVGGINQYVWIPWAAVISIFDPKDSKEYKAWTRQGNLLLEGYADDSWLSPVSIDKPIPNEAPPIVAPNTRSRIRKAVLRFARGVLEKGL